MPINGVQANNNVQPKLQKKNNTLGMIAAGSGLGLVGGGAYGYTRNLLVNKDGFYTNQFVERVSKGFEKQDEEFKKALADTCNEFDDLFFNNQQEVKLTAAQKKTLSTFDPEVQKKIMEELSIPVLDETKVTEFIKKHADQLGINPSSGETIDIAVKKYIDEQPRRFLNRQIMEDENVDTFLKSVISKVSGKGDKAVRIPKDNSFQALRAVINQDLAMNQYYLRQSIESHNDFDCVSQYMDNFFNRSAKKFKEVSESIPKDLMDAVKKAAKEVNTTSAKFKNAAIFGGLAALVAGTAASISSMFLNKSS